MTRLFALAGALGLLLFSSSAFAAAGDPCNYTGDPVQYTPTRGGNVKAVWCVLLVDNATTNAATEFNMATNPAIRGLPDAVSFIVGGDNDCSVGTVTITTAETSGGVQNVLTGSPTLDVDSTSPAGTTRINVNLQGSPIGPFITSTRASFTCTGGADVMMIGYEFAR